MSFILGSITKKYGREAIRDVYKHNPNVFLVISRKLNGNLVVLEAELDNQRHLTKISEFWLDLDPAYVEKARKQGRLHDREEMTTFDLIAYSFTVEEKLSPTQWVLVFDKYKKKRLLISVHEKGVSCYCKQNSEMYKIFTFHIVDRTVMGMLPKVDFVEVEAYNVKTKTKQVDKIVP